MLAKKIVKQTEMGTMPTGWELVRLGDESIVDLIMGQSPPSSTYNDKGIGLPFLQGNAEFGETYPAPILSCSQPIKIAEKNDILLSVRAPVGDINIASCKKISKQDYEMLVRNGCKPKVGDVLFSKDGTVGLSFSYKQKEDIVLLSSIAIITPKESLYSDYCTYVLKSPFVFQQIVGSKRGTGLKRVILHDLKRIKLPLPPLPEQRRIAEILGAVDRKLELERRRKEKLERVKKGLMNELLTGRKRIKVKV